MCTSVPTLCAVKLSTCMHVIYLFVYSKLNFILIFVFSEAVSLQVYGCGQEAAKHALEEVQAVIAAGCCTEKVVDPTIGTISPSTVEGLKHKAEEYGVQILVSKSNSSISISGMCTGTRAMKSIVEVEVDRLTASGRVISKVKWQWKDKDGVYRDYSMGTSDTIEASYQKKELFLFVNTEDGQKFIHFEKMTESSESSITFVRRHDLELEGVYNCLFVSLPIRILGLIVPGGQYIEFFCSCVIATCNTQ